MGSHDERLILLSIFSMTILQPMLNSVARLIITSYHRIATEIDETEKSALGTRLGKLMVCMLLLVVEPDRGGNVYIRAGFFNWAKKC